jgi:hypothetical protein
MMHSFRAAGACFTSLLVACGGGEPGGNGGTPASGGQTSGNLPQDGQSDARLAKLDIADAATLFISDGTGLPLSRYRTVSFGPSSIWFVGENGASLIRWTSSGTTTVPIDDRYDIFSLSAIADDRTVLDAVRWSDGAKILASVRADGGVTTADVGESRDVIRFVKIQ